MLSKHALEFVTAAYIQTLLPAGAVCRRIAFVDVRDGLGVHWTQFRVAGGPPADDVHLEMQNSVMSAAAPAADSQVSRDNCECLMLMMRPRVEITRSKCLHLLPPNAGGRQQPLPLFARV